MGRYIDKSNRRLRWALILANSLSLLGSLLLVIIGTWTLADKSFLAGLLTDRLFVSCAYIQLGAGLLCLGNALFGAYAAFREVKSLLLVYTSVTSLGVTVLVMAGLMAYIFRMQVGENMAAQLVADLHSYDPRVEGSPVVRGWDATQRRLHCCGVLTPQVEVAWQSWSHNTAVNPVMEGMEEVVVPESCCIGEEPCVVNGSTVASLVWGADCYTAGREFLESHSQVMAGVTLSVAVSMVSSIHYSLV